MKRSSIMAFLLMAVLGMATKSMAGPDSVPGKGVPNPWEGLPGWEKSGPMPPPTGFPDDFPVLYDTGGLGKGTKLTGFGGNKAWKKEQNRAAVRKVPVILIHGNAAYAEHPKWGWQTMKGFLKNAGYNDSEIWAVSYLGAQNKDLDMNAPYSNNIQDVRKFIDAVMDYLGVNKVVLIGHSLGAGMVRAYMLGLDSDGDFNKRLTHFEKIAGLITLAGGNYGLGPWAQSEFKTGCPFEIGTHKVPGQDVLDDTPYGSAITMPTNTQANTPLPDGRTYNNGKFGFCGTSADIASDNDARRIFYASLVATGDFVDMQLGNTGYLQGADISKGWNLGSFETGHEQIIKNKEVFEEGILPILQKCNEKLTPPQPGPPVATISPNGGSFTDYQTVTITATNNPSKIEFNKDDSGWQTYSNALTINEKCTIQARATNELGISQVVSASFTQLNYESAYDTLTGHLLARRIDSSAYYPLFRKYRNDSFYLYKIDDVWTDAKPE